MDPCFVPRRQQQKRNIIHTIGDIMSTCGSKTEVYSRVVGFYRPVQQWNDGKQAEFAKRKMFTYVLVGGSKDA